MAVTFSNQPRVLREVGFTKVNGKILIYKKVPKDKDGWADASKYVPIKGELVYLQMANRQVIGWWAGAYWFGPKIKEDDRVTKWKMANFEYD